jgi:hypothetical protein
VRDTLASALSGNRSSARARAESARELGVTENRIYIGALRAWIQVPRGVIVEYARNFPGRFPSRKIRARKFRRAGARVLSEIRLDGARTYAPGGGKIFITPCEARR